LVYSVKAGGGALRQPKAMRYRVQARCFGDEEKVEEEAQKGIRARGVPTRVVGRGPAVCCRASCISEEWGRRAV